LIREWKPCVKEEIEKCPEPQKAIKFVGEDENACCKMPVAYCPKLYCEGEPCAYFAVCTYDRNTEQVTFPCQKYNCPGNEAIRRQRELSRQDFLKSNKGLFGERGGKA
jgi:hypothetical protein